MADSPRKKAYDTKYESAPEQIRHREERNKARRDFQKKNGPLPPSVDIDHKKALDKGGTNQPTNWRPEPAAKNRAWRKNPTKDDPTYGKNKSVK